MVQVHSNAATHNITVFIFSATCIRLCVQLGNQGDHHSCGGGLASIPGRVFAFITVRQTTRPGTSCLRMCQIFIVFVVGKNISKFVHRKCTE